MNIYAIEDKNYKVIVGTNDNIGVSIGDVIVIEFYNQNGDIGYTQGKVIAILD